MGIEGPTAVDCEWANKDYRVTQEEPLIDKWWMNFTFEALRMINDNRL